MISSGDVSGIFAAQNQASLGQLDYSARIGLPGSPLGAFGAPPPQPPGGGFNYGGGGFGGFGYRGGNRFAGSAMAVGSGVGGALSFGSTYLGLAGMLPSRLAGMLPFGAFASTMGGAFAGTGLGLAAAGIGSVVAGGQQQLAFNNSLSNFGFFNPGSRTGMGFGRTEAGGLANLTRSMAELPSMLTSMDELTGILGRLKSTGVMQGVTSATEFGHRFKEAINTIRETAKVLGTTMEQAESFFAHSRSIGFLGKSDQLRNALNVQLTSGMTGMNIGQVMGLQAAGANMATSLGGRRSLGARAITTMAQNIGAATRSGALDEGLIQDMTGLGGSDGIAAAAERMTGLISRMAMGTASGQFMLAGMTKFTNGRASLDMDMARQFSAGLVSFEDLRRRGMGLTDSQKISFRARQADLATAFAGGAGPGGVSRFMGGLVGGRGEDAENLLIQMNGGNASDADFMKAMRGASSDMEFSQFAKLRNREADIRERTSPSAIMRRVMTKVKAGVFGPLEHAGGDILTSISQGYDEFIDDLVGRHVVSLSRGGAQAFARAMSGGNRSELHAMFAAASGATLPGATSGSRLGAFFGRGSDSREMETLLGATGGSAAARLMSIATPGHTTGGEAIADIIDDIKFGNRNFGSLGTNEQMQYVRSNLQKTLNRAVIASGMSASTNPLKLNDTQIGMLAENGYYEAARIARAVQKSRGAAADPFLNIIASGEKLTNGPRIALNRLYDSEAVAASRNAEGLKELNRSAEKGLLDAGLSRETISALRDSPNVRQAMSKVASNDSKFIAAIQSDDAAKQLGLSQAEVEAVRRAVGEVHGSGKNVAGALHNFDVARSASDISVISTAMKSAGAEAAAGAEVIASVGGLKGYTSVLAAVGTAFEKHDQLRSQQSFGDAQVALQNFVKQVYNDKSLTPELRNQLIRASGTIGGAVQSSELFRGILGRRYTKEQLAEKLNLRGPEAMNMLGGLGFVSGVAKTVDQSVFNQLFEGGTGEHAADYIARTGQTNQGGAGREDRIVAVLQRIDANQSVIATILAKQSWMTQDAAEKYVADLSRKYLESESNR
jgi:hypothetical protein